MRSYGKTKTGVVFSVAHDSPMTMKTLTAIHKMVELAAKIKTNKPYGKENQQYQYHR